MDEREMESVHKDLAEVYSQIDQINVRLRAVEAIDREHDIKLALLKGQIDDISSTLRQRESLFMEAREKIESTRRHLAEVIRRVNRLGRR